MLGQKGICGLIVVLCCSLAHSNPVQCHDCWTCLQKEAEELERATKGFFDIPNNSKDISAISARLPVCSGSQNETRHMVKAFHSLFQHLSRNIDAAAEIKSLMNNLEQQEVCLRHWNVSSSPINITSQEKNETDRKILLVKASERYNCIMRHTRDF